MKAHARHSIGTDEIYRALMAERTGENPDNYRNRPFDMELLFHAPSDQQPIEWVQPIVWHWPPRPEHAPQQFGPPPHEPDIEAWTGTGNHNTLPVYRRIRDTPQA